MVFGKLFQGLKKTREKLASSLRSLFGRRKLDEAFLDELEQVLFTADLGKTGMALVEEIKEAYRKKEIADTDAVFEWLRRGLVQRLQGCGGAIARAEKGPTVIMVCGVNGSGKTTSIAKLARHLQKQGLKVMLAAADTFRAAAVEQLGIWAQRLGVPLVRKETGADPAAVAYDAADQAIRQQVDVLIVDTAGRLHTQKHLMLELEKIRKVLERHVKGAPHETLLVLDATTGQNALVQAREFAQVAPITGLVLAKLDGTAKGGAVFGIREQMSLPVKFVGVGEKLDDLEVFDPQGFVDAVLSREELGAPQA
jgi:fused signal recognition particle receptor